MDERCESMIWPHNSDPFDTNYRACGRRARFETADNKSDRMTLCGQHATIWKRLGRKVRQLSAEGSGK